MDRKIGLPPSGSTMGNKALRIKNKLFTASTTTNLRSHAHSPAPSAFLSRCECAYAAHIITLNRQNRLTAASTFETKVLVSIARQRFATILTRAADLRACRALNRASRHLSLRRAVALRQVKRSCFSLPLNVARRKPARTRCEQAMLRCFLPGPVHAQKIAHNPPVRLQTVLRSRASRLCELALLA